MNEKELKKYKRQKLFKTKLFWGIIAGIVFAIIVIVSLPLLSIREINKQTSELSEQVKNDLDNPRLMPIKDGVDVTDIEDFYQKISPTDYEFSDNSFLTNKTDNLKLEEGIANLSYNGLTKSALEAIEDISGAVIYILKHSIGEQVNVAFFDDNDQGLTWGDQNLVGVKTNDAGTENIQNANDFGGSVQAWRNSSVTLLDTKNTDDSKDQTLLINDSSLSSLTAAANLIKAELSYYQLQPIDIDLSDGGSDKTFEWWKADSFDFTKQDGSVVTFEVNKPKFLIETTNDYEYFFNIHTPKKILGTDLPSINLSLGTNVDFATFFSELQEIINNPAHIVSLLVGVLETMLEDPALEGINFFLSWNAMTYSNFGKDEEDNFIHSNTSFVMNNYLKWTRKEYSNYFDQNETSGYKQLTLNPTTAKYEFVDIKQPSERMTYLARVMQLDAFKEDFNNLNADNKFLDWVVSNDANPEIPSGINWNDDAYRFGVLYYLADNYYMLWDGKFRNTKDQIIDDALEHVKLADIPYPFK